METATSSAHHMDRVISVINSELGSGMDALPRVLELHQTALASRRALEQQMCQAQSDAPRQIQAVLRDAEHLRQHVDVELEAEQVWNGDLANHIADTTFLVKAFSQLTSESEEVQRCTNYLKVVSRVEDFSVDIQSALIVNNVEQAVAQFFELSELVEVLQKSKCTNLVDFACDVVIFWYNILRKKFTSEFEEVLQAWKWPFVLSTTKTPPVQNATEIQEKLKPVFVNLLHLQLPDGLCHLQQPASTLVQSLVEWRPVLLPIQLMIQPLSKRFHFHFSGRKQTNSRDKPEWYLSQVLTWIRDHQHFLVSRIQPLLDQEGLTYVDAVVEFSRGLVLLAMEKLQKDLPEVIYDEQTFCHVIDEVLIFHKELLECYNFPANQAGCLHILTQRQAFSKWLQVEKKYAQEKLDEIFSSASAWQCQYKDTSDADDMRVPECGERFITLLMTITDRYKPLPQIEHRLEFLDVILDLLEDYRYRLTQIKTNVSQEPLGNSYAAVLNTISYVIHVLRESSELVFFVELHYFKTMQQQGISRVTETSPQNHSASGSMSIDGESLTEQQSLIFDDIIDLFLRMKNDMLHNLVLYVADDVKARTRSYRNEKWTEIPTIKSESSLALSSSACEMMLVLRERLQQVEQLLSKSLFSELWQRLAEILNNFLYRDLILANSFSEGGAHQLNFDMTRNLFPLFGQYTQRPESYFKDIKEACHVLMVPVGSALLVKETLYRSLHDPSADMPLDPIQVLHEHGVYKLSVEEVEQILGSRTGLSCC